MGGRIVLDACVAINLFATDAVDEIAAALDTVFVLVAQAAAETLYLEDREEGERVATRIDLHPHLDSGALETVELDPAELEVFVSLAAALGEGEAATMTVASCRRLLYATDNRKARRVSTRLNLPTPSTTASLLRTYTNHAGVSPEGVRAMLLDVERRACFRPGGADPDVKWWHDRTLRSG